MAEVIGISGKKQAGKTSLAYYLKARILKDNVPKYNNYSIYQNEDGEVYLIGGKLAGGDDMHPVDELENDLIEVYSFGDALKETCMNTFGLTYEQCYGTDEQKNTPTKYKWDTLPNSIRTKYSRELEDVDEHHTDDSGQFGFTTSRTQTAPRSGYMTAREIMQVFGTDIAREMFDDNIWVAATLSKIERDGVKIAIIADVRFPSEIEGVKKLPNHKFVRLGRIKDASDIHPSETSLDDFSWDRLGESVLVVDNDGMTMDEKNELVYGWLTR